MNKNRTYTIGLGGIALAAIAVAAVSPAKSPARLIQTSSSTDQSNTKKSDQQPNTSVTVNGEPIQLDEQGQAKVNTPNGGTVNVSSKSEPSTSASGTGTRIFNQSIDSHVKSNSSGTAQNSSITSTNIDISGDSATSTSHSSSTTVTGDGSGTISVQSN